MREHYKRLGDYIRGNRGTLPRLIFEIREVSPTIEDFLNHFDKIFNKAKWDRVEVTEVIETTISGSWGNDEPKKDNIAVKVIRGTDLPNIPLFNLRKTPTRFLNKDKVEEIKLQENDIVVELSGGSKDQPTGRSAIITKELMAHFNMPMICSNFCKVIRVNTEKVNPFWFFFFWNQCYEEGLTTNTLYGNNVIRNTIRLCKHWNAGAGYPLESYLMEKDIINLIYWGNEDTYERFLKTLNSIAGNRPGVRQALDYIQQYKGGIWTQPNEQKQFEWLQRLLPGLK